MDDGAFTYNGGRVDPGETQNIRYGISETYMGDPVRIPVTIVNGANPGPTAFFSAAAHGDELNGIEVVRTVAHDWDHSNLHGTLVCLPVLNVPGFLAQQRYLPIYDRDLNRSFPGSETGTSARRMAHRIFRELHLTVRLRAGFPHLDPRADQHAPRSRRHRDGRYRACRQGVRLERRHRRRGAERNPPGRGERERHTRRSPSRWARPTASSEVSSTTRSTGVESVLAEFGMRPTNAVKWPGWRTVIDGSSEKTWLRADTGGLVDMHHDGGDLVREGERVCTITDPFMTESETVRAPFTGLLVGVLENPLVYPGNPLCHLVELDTSTRHALERDLSRSAPA